MSYKQRSLKMTDEEYAQAQEDALGRGISFGALVREALAAYREGYTPAADGAHPGYTPPEKPVQEPRKPMQNAPLGTYGTTTPQPAAYTSYSSSSELTHARMEPLSKERQSQKSRRRR